jgi:hypothetical protein
MSTFKTNPLAAHLLSVVISTPDAEMTRGGMARSYGPAKGRGEGAGGDVGKGKG